MYSPSSGPSAGLARALTFRPIGILLVSCSVVGRGRVKETVAVLVFWESPTSSVLSVCIESCTGRDVTLALAPTQWPAGGGAHPLVASAAIRGACPGDVGIEVVRGQVRVVKRAGAVSQQLAYQGDVCWIGCLRFFEVVGEFE